MYFKQIAVEGMGCLSYVIGCPEEGVACVVDPKRDVQSYIDIAKENGMLITHVFETHIHSDHISGNMELRSKVGADIYYMDGTYVDFDYRIVNEGDVIELGNVKIQILKTPGHTPESMSLLVTDLARGDSPWFVLTGDCLHVNGVGGPDIAGGDMMFHQVSDLYHSLHKVLGELPDSVEIFPAHGQGALFGMGMSSKTSSTIGFEKLSNPQLKLSQDDFEKEFTETFPDRPKSFNHIIETNKGGPMLLEQCTMAGKLFPYQVKDLLDDGAVILDTRDTAAFGGTHIPGSINIGASKQMVNWIGMVIEPTATLVLIVPDEKTYDKVSLQLHRIGYDNIFGYIDGGIFAWQESGYEIDQLTQISTAALNEKLSMGNLNFFDVRGQGEWDKCHIEGAVHMPLPLLLKMGLELALDEEIIITCGMGYRGNIAGSYLKSQGYTNVQNYAGGMKAWLNSGHPVIS